MLTIAGWVFHVPRLADWLGNGITMKVNTAICAAASGVAVALIDSARFVRLARVLAAFVSTLGFLTLVQHLAKVNLGIDTLLFDEPLGAPATAAPGRMGLPASSSFTFLGAALLLASKPGRPRRWAAGLALVPVAVALLSLVGYLYRANQLYSLARLTGIAFQTASMIAALGVGIVAGVPEHGLARAFGRDDAGGMVLRRLFSGVVLFPIVLGWLRLRGQEAGLYDVAFGAAGRTLVEILLLAGLLWWAASGIGRQEQTTREREQLFERSRPRRESDWSSSTKTVVTSSRIRRMSRSSVSRREISSASGWPTCSVPCTNRSLHGWTWHFAASASDTS